MEDKRDSLKRECLGCRRCSIGCKSFGGKSGNVFSNENYDAKIMVVGQNPSIGEVNSEIPFTGCAGENFDNAIKEVLGIDRSYLYITNTVKCCTVDNRRPNKKEVDNCFYFLDKEVEMVNPVVIVTVGSNALRQVTGINGIMKHHGNMQFSIRYGVNVLPLFHPSSSKLSKSEDRDSFYRDLEPLREFING